MGLSSRAVYVCILQLTEPALGRPDMSYGCPVAHRLASSIVKERFGGSCQVCPGTLLNYNFNPPSPQQSMALRSMCATCCSTRGHRRSASWQPTKALFLNLCVLSLRLCFPCGSILLLMRCKFVHCCYALTNNSDFHFCLCSS